MKRTGFLTLFTILAVTAFSQRTNVNFGLKAGINISDFQDDAQTSGRRTGFHAGALAHIHLGRYWAIQPEIMYSTQGAKYSQGTYQTDYINIPILFQYMLGTGFRLQTGPQIGILADAEFERNDGVDVNIKRDLQSSDVSWAVGAGYLTSNGLGVDVRFNIGLTDIRKGTPELKHRVWQFGIFYQFRR